MTTQSRPGGAEVRHARRRAQARAATVDEDGTRASAANYAAGQISPVTPQLFGLAIRTARPSPDSACVDGNARSSARAPYLLSSRGFRQLATEEEEEHALGVSLARYRGTDDRRELGRNTVTCNGDQGARRSVGPVQQSMGSAAGQAPQHKLFVCHTDAPPMVMMMNYEMKETSASRNAGVSARDLRVRSNPRVPSGIWGFGIRVALSGARHTPGTRILSRRSGGSESTTAVCGSVTFI